MIIKHNVKFKGLSGTQTQKSAFIGKKFHHEMQKLPKKNRMRNMWKTTLPKRKGKLFC